MSAIEKIILVSGIQKECNARICKRVPLLKNILTILIVTNKVDELIKTSIINEVINKKFNKMEKTLKKCKTNQIISKTKQS